MTHASKAAACALAVVLIAACAGSGNYETSGADKPRQGYFFVGGRYVETDKGPLMERQMYVEYQLPAVQTQRYPIGMIYGPGHTGRAQRVGAIFCRARLRGVRDRSTGARALGVRRRARRQHTILFVAARG